MIELHIQIVEAWDTDDDEQVEHVIMDVEDTNMSATLEGSYDAEIEDWLIAYLRPHINLSDSPLGQVVEELLDTNEQLVEVEVKDYPGLADALLAAPVKSLSWE